MKNMTLSALALVLALGSAGASLAQVPSGGPEAKGNAPLKHGHTVNDGAAKAGRSSFTMKQAQRHIEHAGYTAVTELTKGDDGVWRGQATKDGTARDIGLDFKGNVSEGGGGAARSSASMSTKSGGSAMMAGGGSASSAAAMPMQGGSAQAMTASASASAARSAHHHRHHRRHHRMARQHCANPSPNGAACSGVDRNMNGISDKEDRAIKGGSKP